RNFLPSQKEHGADAAGPVYWCNGLVLNRDEVPEHVIPLSFTAQFDGFPREFTGEHRWQVQANDLVSWVIEDRGMTAEERRDYHAGVDRGSRSLDAWHGEA